MVPVLSPRVRAQLDAPRQRLRDAIGDRTVAVAQEWLASRAGSEKVFEAIAYLLPDADLFALTHEPGCEIETEDRPVATTLLDRPWPRQHRAVTLPIMPLAWRAVTRHRWDVVVTSSHAFARSFGRHGDLHLSYVHRPARYLWFPELDARTQGLGSLIQRPVRAPLKWLDRSTTARPDSLVANSVTTQGRIRSVYGRDADVSYPPVDTVYYEPSDAERQPRLLAFGRLIPYKRMDATIETAHRLGLPLTIAGTGPDEQRLRRLAAEVGADVDFAGYVTDEEIRRLYQTSAALLFLGNEDFGIVPVEALACGCPVVTAGVGGALETVVDPDTGAHAAGPTIDDFVAATDRVIAAPPSAAACRTQAERFSYGRFGERIADWIIAALR